MTQRQQEKPDWHRKQIRHDCSSPWDKDRNFNSPIAPPAPDPRIVVPRQMRRPFFNLHVDCIAWFAFLHFFHQRLYDLAERFKAQSLLMVRGYSYVRANFSFCKEITQATTMNMRISRAVSLLRTCNKLLHILFEKPLQQSNIICKVFSLRGFLYLLAFSSISR